MDVTIAVLALLSACLHPLWNLLIKGSREPEGVYVALLVVLCVLGALHAAWAGVNLASARPVWDLFAISAVGEFVYGICVLVTLRRGDLSVYYPIIRSSPLFIVIVGATLLGQRYGALLLVGIGVTVLGAFLLQYRRGGRWLHDPVAFAAAMLAMMGAGVYAIADARALQQVEPMVRFFWVELVQIPAYIAYFAFVRRPGYTLATRLLSGWRATPWRYLGVGLLAYASYFLILLAFKLGGDAAAVSAVRQASIPISVLLGTLYLREAHMRARLLWSLVLAAGIVIIIAAPAPR